MSRLFVHKVIQVNIECTLNLIYKIKNRNLGRIGITTIDEEQFKELENIVEM